jgi:hypothetical protein
VPLLARNLDTTKNLLDRRHIEIIESSTATPSKKNPSRDAILNKKIPRVKLKEDIIIKCKLFNREEIASDRRDMKNITEVKIMG